MASSSSSTTKFPPNSIKPVLVHDMIRETSLLKSSTATDHQPHQQTSRKNNNRPLNQLVTTLISNCLACNGSTHFTMNHNNRNNNNNYQFIELKGIRFIGLGAVVDELTPKERIYDTLEVYNNTNNKSSAERLACIGYILDDHNKNGAAGKTTETVSLELWSQDFPNYEKNSSISNPNKKILDLIREQKFTILIDEFTRQLDQQKNRINSGLNFFLAGITAHNLGVAKLLAGGDEDDNDNNDIEQCFRDAIEFKQAAFGIKHEEVALSYDELGILLFSRGDFNNAITAFQTAHDMRVEISSNNSNNNVGQKQQQQDNNNSNNNNNNNNPILAMTLNNIACCEYQMGNRINALKILEKAKMIQTTTAVSGNNLEELDLLHVATVYGNCGYLHLSLKQYDEARALFDETLLIQQSVLSDNYNHRAVRDTISNIEFTNAFHF